MCLARNSNLAIVGFGVDVVVPHGLTRDGVAFRSVFLDGLKLVEADIFGTIFFV